MDFTHTPWGTAQETYEHAPGLVFVSTSSHGGFWLDELRWKSLQYYFPDFRPFAGHDGWLEEDCDAVLAILTFPDKFSEEEIYEAVKMSKASISYPVPVSFWSTKPGEKAVEAYESFQKKIKHLWRRGSVCGDRDGIKADFIREIDHARKTVYMYSWPGKKWYTTEELDNMNDVQEETETPHEQQA